MNAVVYVDFENIMELLKQYGKAPLEMDFFQVIKTRLKDEYKLNIIDFIVYSNFEKKPWNTKQQTYLRSMGMETRQASNNGKNSGDLELTVDALRVLYKTQSIGVFVIISSDRDIIPLLKAIKYENKTSCVISTRNGFNKTVAEYADHHEYLEDIFHLTTRIPAEPKPVELDVSFDLNVVTTSEINRAREVSGYFYNSQIWKRALKQEEPVSLNGYLNVITRILNRFPAEILNDFKLAHHLKYITIYQDGNQKLCIKEGERKEEVS